MDAIVIEPPPFLSALKMLTHTNESGNPHAGTSDVLVVSATTKTALEIRDEHCRNGVGQTGGRHSTVVRSRSFTFDFRERCDPQNVYR